MKAESSTGKLTRETSTACFDLPTGHPQCGAVGWLYDPLRKTHKRSLDKVVDNEGYPSPARVDKRATLQSKPAKDAAFKLIKHRHLRGQVLGKFDLEHLRVNADFDTAEVLNPVRFVFEVLIIDV
jgi:hypothetical protein